jgi:hypothetical protein
MANLNTFADVLTTDSISWVAYTSGVKKNPPGVPLKEILQRTGGIYEQQLKMSPKFREKLRTAGRLTGDKELEEMADTPVITISLEHLRGVDLDTRIIIGFGLEYTPEEVERFGLQDAAGFDNPANTIEVEVDPDHPWRVKQG